MKNVLLACMSTVSAVASKNVYRRDESKNIYFDAYMTNEAPAKAAIKKLHDQGQYLEKVVLLCTDKVLNENVELLKRTEKNELGEILDVTPQLLEEMQLKACLVENGTASEEDIKIIEREIERNGKKSKQTYYVLNNYKHIDFYKEKVNAYAELVDAYYKKHPIEYVTVGIPDFMKEQEITKSTLESAKNVIDEEEQDEVCLYIDYNGGHRSVAFMVIAISNLMKLRNIKIQETMYMNFDNKMKEFVNESDTQKTEVICIQNMMSVFESFELVNGINEYIRYGYIEGLKKYFEKSGNQKIDDVLKKMETFANDLQLCRTSKIIEDIKQLSNSFNIYKSTYQNNKFIGVYEQLFLHVLQDIEDGYKEILDGKIPNIIKWCVERGLAQQALTFCSEELAGYFWDKKIYYATEEEKNAYKIINSTKKREKQLDSRNASDWLITYLRHTENIKKKDRLNNTDISSEYKQMIELWPDNDIDPWKNNKDKNNSNIGIRNARNADLDKIQKNYNKYDKFNLSFCIQNSKYRDGFLKARREAMVLLYWKEAGHARSKSELKDDKLLGEILTVYFLLKYQRNKTNHASADSDAWEYKDLCNVMTQMADVLKKVTVR